MGGKSRGKVSVIQPANRTDEQSVIQIQLSRQSARQFIDGNEELILQVCKDMQKAIDMMNYST